MKFMDDIDVLKAQLCDDNKSEQVLAEQIRLIRRYAPFAIAGTIFTGLCFFFIASNPVNLTINQKILNIAWVIHHTITTLTCWLCWYQILKHSNNIQLNFLKCIFVILSFVLIFMGALSFLILLFVWHYYYLETIEQILVGVWVVFYAWLVGLCWISWKKVEHLMSSFYKADSTVNERYTGHQAEYLAHYASYQVLLICNWLVGSLWALAVAKVICTNIQDYIQVLVIMVLYFGLLGGAISSIAMFWRAYISLVLPSLLTWGLVLLYVDNYQLKVLVIVVIALLFLNILFSRFTWINTLKSILLYLENTRLISQLRIKTQQVEQASLAKTRFLATASHDLRQPAHALSLFMATLADTKLDAQQRQIVEYAQTASQSSREMLNAILDYTHLEAGEMKPHIVVTELDSLIQSLVDEFAMQARSKQLTLHYQGTDVWVMTDPAMLSLILRNFISNAIRYTDQGSIEVLVEQIPVDSKMSILLPSCRISVCDSGSGLTQEEIEHVFDSFYQLERNKKSNQGLGLGLAIVKGMAQLLDIKIDVQSELGQGSKFSVSLPICTETHNSDASYDTVNNCLVGVKLLLVDNDETVLISMQMLLEIWGCQVAVAQTLEEALDIFRSHRPSIVITDFRLAQSVTGGDVITAITDLHKMESTQTDEKVHFIILTADTRPEIITKTQKINSEVLHKPIDPKVLQYKLQEIVSRDC
ncbi:hybrid sensor histidine kinase/response regulator [Psychrobacter sp. I-STPA6b]|uniref:ATP-binding response regulator n=1 Tax=Psychrobacter sp. I-STPA6b TaxID=2585718 RepID=UPI001D0C5B39|nr:hybrid sensor histidine kinase/response regulator [Psychrobacter sp. I-STPA6b]